MKNKDEELRKLNSIDIKMQNPQLQRIQEKEKQFINAFNSHFKENFKEHYLELLQVMNDSPNTKNVKTKTIVVEIEKENKETGQKEIEKKEYTIPENILQDFHKSYIEDDNLREYYVSRLREIFSEETAKIRTGIKNNDSFQDLLSVRENAFALSSLAITAFHNRPHMVLRKAQKRAGLAISEGNIAELATGEGKTLAAVLPSFLHALREKGVHVITANSYLSKRDYEELLPIYTGLGLTVGYLPSSVEELALDRGMDYEELNSSEERDLRKELVQIKQDAYKADITFGETKTFAFDYLGDNIAKSNKDRVQRPYDTGFAIMDEIDLIIDEGQNPFVISKKEMVYTPGMSLKDLCDVLELSYENNKDILVKYVKDPNKITYNEARYIANTFCDCELMESSERYQELAEEFFKFARVFKTEGNMFEEGKTSEQLFEDLCDDEKYILSDEFKNSYDIIYCEELKKYKVLDDFEFHFLRYCYFNMQINTPAMKYKDKIIKDENYVENTDYFLDSNGEIRMTSKGSRKIIKDSKYPEFIEDYNRYVTRASNYTATILHYFYQAINANLLMKKEVDYDVVDGKVKVLKSGRVQEGSEFSNGLHQAIELKEKITPENQTKESLSTSSVTHLGYFFRRYNGTGGMTGTSTKIFEHVFNKKTVKIPRAIYEEKDIKEIRGVDNKDIEFTLTQEDKINLIVQSVLDSQTLKANTRKQPVLIFATDPDEIPLLVEKLSERGLNVNVIKADTPKEEEAFKIACAGLPGNVTITTAMCGRGTDIKLGGDRNTILDIEFEQFLKNQVDENGNPYKFTLEQKDLIRRKIEEDSKSIEVTDADGEVTYEGINSQEVEDQYRKDLQMCGLKVIISGLYPDKRSINQCRGRTGRNGETGTTEIYASVHDLEKIGIMSANPKTSIDQLLSKFKREANGKLNIDKKTYSELLGIIDRSQKNYELKIERQIKESQRINGHAERLIDELRNQRGKLSEENSRDYINDIMKQIIVDTVDAIISSFVKDKEITKESLTKPLNNNGLDIDVETISLEIKKVFGITFDPNIVEKSKMNLLEFRDSLIRTANVRKALLNIVNDKDKQKMFEQNDFMLSCIDEILEKTFTRKNLTLLSAGMEGQKDSISDITFGSTVKMLRFESYKNMLTSLMGLPLTFDEFTKLDSKKEEMYNLIVKRPDNDEKTDVDSALYKENNLSVVSRIRLIKKQLDREDQREIRRIEHQIEQFKKKEEEPDLERLYRRLHTRPMQLLDKMVDGNVFASLKVIKKSKEDAYAIPTAEKGIKRLIRTIKPNKTVKQNDNFEKEEAS